MGRYNAALKLASNILFVLRDRFVLYLQWFFGLQLNPAMRYTCPWPTGGHRVRGKG